MKTSRNSSKERSPSKENNSISTSDIKQSADQDEVKEIERGKSIALNKGRSLRSSSRLWEAACISPSVLRWLVTAAIVCNSIQLGVCIKRHEETGCQISDLAFTLIFALEVIVKLHAQRCKYFRNYFNVLDFSLVWLGIVDLGVTLLKQTCNACRDLSIVRVLRLLRTLRLMRVLKAKRELAVLVEGFVASINNMLWVCVLQGLFIYASCIFFISILGEEEYTAEIGFEVPYFDNLFEASLTLFNIAILAEWGEICRPLWQSTHWWKTVFFIAYIFVATFGILNLLIGIIVETSAEVYRKHEKRIKEQEKEQKMDEVHAVASALFDADDDGDQKLSALELENADKESLVDLLDAVEFPPGFTVADLHLMISANNNIAQDEFIRSMKRIIFSNEFQRDCQFQHGLNAMMRKLVHLEGIVSEVLSLLTKKPEQCARSNGEEKTMNRRNLQEDRAKPVSSQTSMQDDTGETSRMHSCDDMKGLRKEIHFVQGKLTAELANIKDEIVSDMMLFCNKEVCGKRDKNPTAVDVHGEDHMIPLSKKTELFASSNGEEKIMNRRNFREDKAEPVSSQTPMQDETGETSRMHSCDDMKGLRKEINFLQDKLTAEIANIKDEIVSDMMLFCNKEVYGKRDKHPIAVDVHGEDHMITDVKAAVELDQILLMQKKTAVAIEKNNKLLRSLHPQLRDEFRRLLEFRDEVAPVSVSSKSLAGELKFLVAA